MQKHGVAILAFALTALIVVIGVALYVNRPRDSRPAGPEEFREGVSGKAPEPRASRPIASTEEPQAEAAADEDGLPVLSRDKVEEFVRSQNRSRSSLLAAYHALGDTNYLREAATNFPGDPQLQWTILACNAFPAERRKWLDAFKASSPDNAVADYLSAHDHFKGGQVEAALAEMEAATGKAQFKDYRIDTQLDGEELAGSAGETGRMQFTAGMAAVARNLLPDLSTFRDLTRETVALQKQYTTAGDTDSAMKIAEMGLLLAGRFQQGDGSRYLMNQVTGVAMEAAVLQTLDANTSYEFLGGKTPAQLQAERKQQRAELIALTKTLGHAVVEMTDAEFAGYAQRQKIYGEIEAARWLQERLKPAAQ